MSLSVFGDSIAWGSWDPDEGGWVTQLRKHIEKSSIPIQTHNCGIPGNTTTDLLNRFDIEASARTPQILIFQIGINDSCFNQRLRENITPIANFDKNIKTILQKGKEHTDNIIFLSLTKVNEPQINPTPWNKELYYFNKEISKFNNIIKKNCRKHKIDFLNITNNLNQKDFVDGLHPNSTGHKKIFEVVKEYLTIKKQI